MAGESKELVQRYEDNMPKTLKQRARSALKAKISVPHSASTTTHFFGKIANATSRAAGHASTFIAAIVLIIVWAFSGPYFGYSDTWQLVINTNTTIITFLMVFLISEFPEQRQCGDTG